MTILAKNKKFNPQKRRAFRHIAGYKSCGDIIPSCVTMDYLQFPTEIQTLC